MRQNRTDAASKIILSSLLIKARTFQRHCQLENLHQEKKVCRPQKKFFKIRKAFQRRRRRRRRQRRSMPFWFRMDVPKSCSEPERENGGMWFGCRRRRQRQRRRRRQQR